MNDNDSDKKVNDYAAEFRGNSAVRVISGPLV